ncbi:hypothetical protein AY599_26240 [Leptolyngbya valderiana BDU 20041]|uniref:hypothetical protein n=1 Tax=Baaleninema simplex TaxID=2862350 RepID=UPI0003482A9A|nr:hypothetical protein [Baaleninema simplex]MDC0835788.1 hypothetical protein [Geitlerinema sp. CS-897]OAB55459.1 hypothetical protein AY599_26240 [Leptolyngbya valderiana BDU 20041]PPT05473.1 Glutamine synthetase inactivating factor IF7 [Geitlerinema sp. FC II]
MSLTDRSRALMSRHHQNIRNRQQSLLSRAAAEVGMPGETAEHWTHIQGKPAYNNAISYDRSNAAMS